MYTHEKKISKCDTCHKQFPSDSDLKSHFSSHKKSISNECGSSSPGQIIRYSGSKSNMPLNEKNSSTEYDICCEQVTFDNDYSHPPANKTFTLDEYFEDLRQENDLELYLSDNTTDNNQDYTKSFLCDVCLKEFPKKKLLKCHYRSHTGKKSFSCVVCYKSFSSKKNLKSHFLSHTGKKIILCVTCHKKKSSDILSSRVHMRGSSFLCSMCHKIIPKRDFKLLLRSIVGKKFFCNICHKQFASKKILKQHKSVHARKKTTFCDMCHKKLDRKDIRIRLHFDNSETSFLCKECQKHCSKKST